MERLKKMTCRILLLKNGKQISAGTFSLVDGRVVAMPEKGYDYMLTEMQSEPSITPHGEHILMANDPGTWLRSLPSTYTGTYLRAEILPVKPTADLESEYKKLKARVAKLSH